MDISQNLDYLSENSLSIYPFKDNSSLLSQIQDTVDNLPDNVFADLLICTDSLLVRKAYLYSFSYVTISSVRMFIMTFWFTTDNVSKLAEINYSVDVDDLSLFGTQVISGVTDTGIAYAIKLVVGQGFLDYIAAGNEFLLRFFNTSTVQPYLEVSPSCIVPPQPTVSEIGIYNYDSTSQQSFITKVNSFDVDKPASILPGANISYTEVGNRELDLAVGPNLGTGLFNDCPDLISSVNTINALAPDKYNNFLFSVDLCLQVTPKAHSLAFSHTCKPKCTPDELSAFAHYLNRIKDAVVTLSEFGNSDVDSIKNKLFVQMQNYQTKLDRVQAIAAPYIEAEQAKTTTTNYIYTSFAIGIYDPNKSEMTVHFKTVTDNDSYTSPDVFTYIDDTASLKDNGNSYPLPFDVDDTTTWKFTDRTVNCQGSVIAEFVTKIPTTNTDRLMSFFMSEATSYSHPSASFKLLVINPSGYYYTLKTKRIWEVSGSRYRYYFTIDLFNPTLSATLSNVKSTNLSVTLPGSLSYVTGSAALILDNGSPVPLAGSLSSIVSSISIDYSRKSTMTFEATYSPGSSSDEQTLEFSLSATLAVDSHTFSQTFNIR